MSTNTGPVVDILFFIERIIMVVILLLATYRALKIGRSYFSSVYRNRAYWLAALTAIFIVTDLNVYVSYPNTSMGWLLNRNDYNLPFLVELALALAFIDSVNLVAIDMDFFHRNSLYWKQLRIPTYTVFLVNIFILSTLNVPLFNILSSVLPAVCAGYAIAVLIVASRRSSDLTMKRHTRLLGYAFVIFLASVIVFSISVYGNLVSDLFLVIFAYLIYLATMSLSPLNRFEEIIA
jgi:hypothetical protein